MYEEYNQTAITYQGLVDIKYLANGKELVLHKHNEGLTAMFKFLCKVLSGDLTSVSSDVPKYVDVRCKYIDSTSGEPVETSVLYSPLSISNPGYTYDASKQSWVTKYNITIAYNMIDTAIVDKLPGNYDTIIYLQSSTDDFAKLQLEKDDGITIADIIPGTQALIQWTILLQNKPTTAA